MDAESLVRPVIEGEGFELVEVALTRDAGRDVLRVTVDRPDGLDLDTVSELSLKLSRELDDVDFGTGPYALEVSSPGIERRLKNPAHFVRATGQLTKVKTIADPGSGPAVHTGVLLQADDEGIVLLDGGQELRVAYGEIASASTVADWDAELKRSHT
jgi:ribosome maturation factor RimP